MIINKVGGATAPCRVLSTAGEGEVGVAGWDGNRVWLVGRKEKRGGGKGEGRRERRGEEGRRGGGKERREKRVRKVWRSIYSYAMHITCTSHADHMHITCRSHAHIHG